MSSGKLFATMLLHIPYCEKLFFASAQPRKGWDPGLQTKISLYMFQYLLHLCLQTKIGKQLLQSDLVIAKLFHIKFQNSVGPGHGAFPAHTHLLSNDVKYVSRSPVL